MKTFTTNTFLTHLRPHLDEIASYWMLVRWGESFFPGIAQAEIRYLTTGILPDEIPPEILAEKGILPVGVGGGFLDEHPSSSFGRKENECAASLTLAALQLKTDVTLQRIVSEIRHCDLTNQVNPTQLSTLIKLRHRRNPSNAQKVFDWVTIALNALYAGEARLSKEADMFGLVKKTWKGLITEYGWDHPHALEHVKILIAKTESVANDRITELANIFRILYKIDKSQALSWLTEVLCEMYQDSCEFFKAIEEINAHAETVEFHSGKETFPVMAICSDTEHISLAARSKFCGYNALVIQRNAKGATQVFLNVHNVHVQKEKLNLDNLVRMLRLREQTRLGYPQGLWDAMATEGTIPRIRMWYYSKDGDVILNGCLTTPDVKPSKLSLKEILTISQSAFNRESVYQWRRKYAFLADKQASKGTFRSRSQSDYGFLKTAHSSNLTTLNLPSREEVEAELNRIMVLS